MSQPSQQQQGTQAGKTSTGEGRCGLSRPGAPEEGEAGLCLLALNTRSGIGEHSLILGDGAWAFTLGDLGSAAA